MVTSYQVPAVIFSGAGLTQPVGQMTLHPSKHLSLSSSSPKELSLLLFHTRLVRKMCFFVRRSPRCFPWACACIECSALTPFTSTMGQDWREKVGLTGPCLTGVWFTSFHRQVFLMHHAWFPYFNDILTQVLYPREYRHTVWGFFGGLVLSL